MTMKKLFEKMDNLSQTCENLVILGDFNFPSLKWPLASFPEPHNSETHFCDLLLNSNLSQLITEATRFKKNQEPSTLDLLLTNEEFLVCNIEVEGPIGKSDHAVVQAELQFSTNSDHQIQNQKKYYQTNFHLVCNDLAQLDWDRMFLSLNLLLRCG